MSNITIKAGEQVKVGTLSSDYDAQLYVPEDYDSSKSYPLIIFLRGIGENTVDKIPNQGLPRCIRDGNPPFAITDDGRVDFIVLSPLREYFLKDTSDAIKWAKNNFSIDENRVYITGLSAGARSTAHYISHQYDDGLEKVQAAVPMSYTLRIDEMNENRWMKDWNAWKGHGCWAFTGQSDMHTPVNEELVRHVNEVGGKARLTIYPGGHCCWPAYYDPEYRENINGKMMNIYEWMLQFTGEEQSEPVEEKPIHVEPPKETAPVEPDPIEKLEQPFAIISCGKHDNNNGIITSDNKVTLDGSNSTGTIDSWHWGKLSGPDCHINNNGSTAEITGLQEGDYVFYLSVSSNQIGWPSSDKVTVRVKQEETLPITIKNVEVIYSDGTKSIFDDIECIDIDFKDGTNKIIQ